MKEKNKNDGSTHTYREAMENDGIGIASEWYIFSK
jgi:hypothetical protein